ncbi:maleylpyruvate isomerase N-terminal domain-containing protein [Nonomuraea sp. CA-141351]|uniref:maleylpyruvate isomerase N-terminal domain-containing protein n=1 Tax=Nonomuraea sp. CA-141351 TaxID=3239996 RepID=UPI003D8ABCF8
MTVLSALQAELVSATNQLLATAASLSDADIAAPSLLPGWTRGHVLAHVAQNADSHINLLTWAKTGARLPQYASYEARAAAIEPCLWSRSHGAPLVTQATALRPRLAAPLQPDRPPGTSPICRTAPPASPPPSATCRGIAGPRWSRACARPRTPPGTS